MTDDVGIVLVVDYLNLLVRAFHAGAPSRIHAVRGMLDTLRLAIERTSPEYLIVALDGGHADRTALHAGYKSHRPPKPPELEEQIKLGLQAIEAIGWPSLRVIDWEADDVIASLATAIAPTAAGVLVCSSDKDLLSLLTIPGVSIYHPWDGGKVLGTRSVKDKFQVEAGQILDYLALVGDKSDSVPGVDGIGPKKAVELLAAHGNLDGILEAARTLRVPGAIGKRLVDQADVARLCRRLVELRRDLPIGERWREFPLRAPRAGWQDRLHDVGVISSAHRLADLLPVGVEHSAPSHVEITPMAQKIIESSRNIAESGQNITESSHELPVPEGMISDEISSWAECPARLPAGATLIDRLRAIYRVGLTHHRAGITAASENGYRSGTAHHVAFAQGLAFRALSIDLADFDSTGERLPAKPQKPVRSKSLF